VSIKIVIDMNLSPDWVPVLNAGGWPAVHWSAIGAPGAPDKTVMSWAVANAYVVFTHDLEFGTLLALTNATAPSVIQVRSQDVLPDHLQSLVANALRQYESELASGAIVTVNPSKHRVRVLPLKR
jgi:predicted nuclease of predicted toxin-antitoxin system